MRKIIVPLLALGLVVPAARAEVVRVAVAANFLPTLQDLAPLFRKQTGDRVLVTSGSTGQLYAQIVNGAPFDVFLAADRQAPQRLVAMGMAVRGSVAAYAVGRLVLWSRFRQTPTVLRARLDNGSIERVALADPAGAPYGRAGRQALKGLGAWGRLQGALVYGASVGQAFQFAASGNAGAAFVALSQVLHYRDGGGACWRVPQRLYDPLVQEMALLKGGRTKGAARAFMSFIKGPRARGLIERSGYGLPHGRAGRRGGE